MLRSDKAEGFRCSELTESDSAKGRRRVEPPRTPISKDLETGPRKEIAKRPPESPIASLDQTAINRPSGASERITSTRSTSVMNGLWVFDRRRHVILTFVFLGLLVVAGLTAVIQRGGSNSENLFVDASVPKDAQAPEFPSSTLGSLTTLQSPETEPPELSGWSSISRSVVFVDASEDPVCMKSGSGSIVGDGSFVLTNEHVVMYEDGSTSCRLSIWLARSENETPSIRYRAEVIVADRRLDLAILRVLDEYGVPVIVSEAPPLKFAAEAPKLGQEIMVLGYPGVGGSRITLSSGRYAGLSDHTPPYYKTDATINSGNSGGGAFDSNQELVGVATAVAFLGSDESEIPLGLLRPITDAILLLDEARSMFVDLQQQEADWNMGGSVSEDSTDLRFATCKEAKFKGYGPYWYGIDPEYDWYNDRDSDGVVCE